ncbi:MAG: restriction endonuclease subunit S [Clostridiales bacterium]|nr:restriction endonuclease subunit S [Clostridiales bacterium]
MRIVNLGDIATYINGYAFKPTDWETEGLPIIRIQNLNNPKQEFNYFKGNIADKYVVRHGDILISWSASIGVFEWDREDAVLNQHIFKVVFDKEKINKTYFKFMVSIALDKAMQYMHGSTMKHITKGYFDAIPVPVPDLKIQEKIAQILKKSQELLNTRKEQLQACDELIKSQFIEMFGDPVTNPKSWDKLSLAELSELITKGASPNWQGIEYVDDSTQTLFVTSENVREGYLDLTKTKYLQNEFNEKQKRSVLRKGDFLINIVGASIGRAAQFNLDCTANINQAVALVRVKQGLLNDKYLLTYLNSPKALQMYETMQVSVARANLSLQNISDLEILVPPIELQNQFAEFVQQVDKLKFEMEQSLIELENNFNSLMQRAFKGELF